MQRLGYAWATDLQQVPGACNHLVEVVAVRVPQQRNARLPILQGCSSGSGSGRAPTAAALTAATSKLAGGGRVMRRTAYIADLAPGTWHGLLWAQRAARHLARRMGRRGPGAAAGAGEGRRRVMHGPWCVLWVGATSPAGLGYLTSCLGPQMRRVRAIQPSPFGLVAASASSWLIVSTCQWQWSQMMRTDSLEVTGGDGGCAGQQDAARGRHSTQANSGGSRSGGRGAASAPPNRPMSYAEEKTGRRCRSHRGCRSRGMQR